ncbi:hypothetical protein G7Y89_g8419 [Cudoniella acicularis]|uniref:Major facilitator superfamily (MFS) profile domain-containing protein n=1 Tax=Cudoniella acicularis TaxID=354080 RepID=A0A8H4RGK4_9HELO|nr:hypothetical protein G7Y89_g8419 [Cudoniella acicularis]
MSSEQLLNDGYRSQSIESNCIDSTNENPNDNHYAYENEIPKDNHYVYENHGSIRTFFIICNLACISLTNTAVTGMLIVGIPEIARKLAIPDYLLLCLTSGSCLLAAGVIADITNPKIISIGGALLLGLSIVGSGLSYNGHWLIAARAVQGVAIAMCLPTSVVLLTGSLPPGQRRNIGFSTLNLATVLGQSIGLVLGSVVDYSPTGWRFGFYLCGAATIALAIANCFVLPSGMSNPQFSWARVVHDVDWIGVLISSTSLGCFSYIFALMADRVDAIKLPENVAILCLAILLIPTFFLWMHRQQRNGGVALIPNKLWTRLPFLTICVMVLLQYAVIQSVEVYFSLFVQKIQRLPAKQASLRLIPNMLMGFILNPTIGLAVQHVRIDYLLTIASMLSAVAPLLLALTDPAWSYWYAEFWSMLLSGVAVDVTFTIAHLIVVDVFPLNTHALAGAVFNTASQFGFTGGLAVMALISSAYSKHMSDGTQDDPESLLSWWLQLDFVQFGN